ncbi:MAG TPA: polyamine aminopropyltransferase [Thermopetrobacter sp.]|nr:polyamine aminopropyltransferase [Thermopetrobacter sp.]
MSADDDIEIDGWWIENLHDGYRQMLKIDRLLYDSKTDKQRIRVFENATFGRVLTLDDILQTTERDEFMYHEMLAHVPILAHGAVHSVLIIGGGDGGMLREVARHKAIGRIVQVEIDEQVIAFAKEYLPMLSAGAFDDPRVELVISDGAKYVAEADDTFDVIIVDSTDPIGPGAALFSDAFYADCARRLADGGVIVTQNGVPFTQADEVINTMTAFKGLFADYTCYTACIPGYAGGQMAFGWGTNDEELRATPLEVLQRRYRAENLSTRYYTPEVHQAAFALPRYIKDLIP